MAKRGRTRASEESTDLGPPKMKPPVVTKPPVIPPLFVRLDPERRGRLAFLTRVWALQGKTNGTEVDTIRYILDNFGSAAAQGKPSLLPANGGIREQFVVIGEILKQGGIVQELDETAIVTGMVTVLWRIFKDNASLEGFLKEGRQGAAKGG